MMNSCGVLMMQREDSQVMRENSNFLNSLQKTSMTGFSQSLVGLKLERITKRDSDIWL